MKRIFSFLLSITLLCGLLPAGALTAGAVSETDIPYAVEGGNIYFDPSTGTITGCDDSVIIADIPAEIDGMAVTAIGTYAFYGHKTLTKVNIPDSVLSIGNGAFDSCEALTTAIIGDGVSEIPFHAFWGCESLEIVSLGENVTTIDSYSFSYCYNLTGIVFPKSVMSIGNCAFLECNALSSAYFGGNSPQLGYDVFTDHNKYEPIKGLTFYYVEGAEGWTSPTWNGYPTAAWAPEKGIAYPVESGNIYFDPATGTVIGCDESITKADIPEKIGGIAVIAIGDSAFSHCMSLTAVTIPDGVTNIGRSAFIGCNNLTDVVLPDSVENINGYAFAGTALTEISLGNSLKTLGENVFVGCTTLKSIEFPVNLESIGEQVFFRCTALEEITVASGNSTFAAKDGVLFSKDMSTLIIYPEGKDEKTYAIPEGTESIGKLAFHFNKHLTAVTMPKSLDEIGEQAFMECYELVSVTFPQNLTNIGEGAFSYCHSLQKAEIPEGITEIRSHTFSSCYELSSVSLPESLTVISEYAFEWCKVLPKIVIPDKVSSIGSFAFRQNAALQSVYFQGDAPEIGEYVFYSWNSQDEFKPTEGLTLYYKEGKTGWTSPQWNGYPSAVWNDTDTPHTHNYKAGVCTECGEKDPNYIPMEFNDVSENAWYKDAIDYAVANGLMNGMGDGKFEPETKMSRAMLVTVLWRYAGSPDEGENIFSDVADNQWYTKAVAWAAHNGIVGGIGGGKFDPDGTMTREQLATVLYRYSKSLGLDVSKTADLTKFPDGSKASSYATDALSWAVATGLTAGTEVNGKVYLDPQGSATRAQVATILMRFIENIL